MNYLYIKDNKIVTKGNLKNLTEGVENLEVSDEVFENSDKYVYKDNQIVLDLNYDKKQEIKSKKERILNIKEELNNLDLKSIRAIRANETDKIEFLENQAKALREEMENLNAEL